MCTAINLNFFENQIICAALVIYNDVCDCVGVCVKCVFLCGVVTKKAVILSSCGILCEWGR